MNVNVGLFTYPILMASDILLFNADKIPVGKDQIQHLEIARDVAKSFNKDFPDTFNFPEPILNDNISHVPGTNGIKMSKSYNNCINPLIHEKELKKQINSILTNSKSVDEPKNPNECILYKIYSLIADNDEINLIKNYYINGGIGYGEIKNKLFEYILTKYSNERKIYSDLIKTPEKIEEILKMGESKTKLLATEKMNNIKSKLKLI